MRRVAMAQETSRERKTQEGRGLRACEPHLRALVLARNASGVRRLVEQHEVPRGELEPYLRALLEEQVREGTPERIGPRFDIHTAGYSTLEEWVGGFLKSLGRVEGMRKRARGHVHDEFLDR
jgi:hypothetical protein